MLDRVHWVTADLEGTFEKYAGWKEEIILEDTIWALMLGLVVCAMGWMLHLFWIILGGFLFFFLGIQAIRNEKGKGGHEAGDVSEKPRAPLV